MQQTHQLATDITYWWQL